MENTSFRLVALDIDGTLLNSAGMIAERTFTTIQSALAKQMVIVLSTSRRWVNTKPIADSLNLHGPHILYDGALIIDKRFRQKLASHPLAPKTSLHICQTLIAENCDPIVQYATIGHEWMTVSPRGMANPVNRRYVEAYRQQVVVRSDEVPYRRQSHPLRIVAFGEEETLDRLAVRLLDLDCRSHLLNRGSYGNGELTIFHKLATKGNALSQLAQLLDIPLAQTIAVGDSPNDCSMFAVAGLAIAMGQSTDEVKACAHAVTTTNDEDGVALALEKWLDL